MILSTLVTYWETTLLPTHSLLQFGMDGNGLTARHTSLGMKLARHTETLRIQPCPQHVGRPHYRWPLPQALQTPRDQDLDCTDFWTLCTLCVQISVIVTSGWSLDHENVQTVAVCFLLEPKPSLCCWVVQPWNWVRSHCWGTMIVRESWPTKDWWRIGGGIRKLWDEATLRTVRP